MNIGRNLSGEVSPRMRRSLAARYQDDVIKWKHFPRYWPFVREIHRSPFGMTLFDLKKSDIKISHCHINNAWEWQCPNRPEVRKLLLFYFFFFSTWSWKIIPYLLFYFFSNWSWKVITYLRFYFFSTWSWKIIPYFDGVVQDCSNSSDLAMELLQSCTKPSIYFFTFSRPRSRSRKSANSLELLQSCAKPSKYGIIFQLQVEKKKK